MRTCVLALLCACAVSAHRPQVGRLSNAGVVRARAMGYRARTAMAADEKSGAVRQLLGLKDASAADTSAPFNWKIRLQLMKPATWIPLIWGVACGAAASGNYHAVWNLFGDAPTTDSVGLVVEDVFKAVGAMMLSGPILCGFTQTINDWYDRDLDAINEPYRPIPSGAISEAEVFQQIYGLLIGGIGLAIGLDFWAEHEWPVVCLVATIGIILAYTYSVRAAAHAAHPPRAAARARKRRAHRLTRRAPLTPPAQAPPFKLKANGWTGTFALGSSYIALPWWCGHAMFNAATICPQEVVLTILYSIAGLGIAIVNDFKSIEGDRELGMNSLPVAFGVDTAKWLCVGAIDLTQLGVAAYLYSIGELRYAAILLALILPQMYSQVTFVEDPINNDVKYQAAAQPFLVLGILTTAIAVGHHTF